MVSSPLTPRNSYSASQVATQEGGVISFAFEPHFELIYHSSSPDVHRNSREQLYPLGTSYEVGPNKYRYCGRAAVGTNPGFGQIATMSGVHSDLDNFRVNATQAAGAKVLPIRSATNLVAALDQNELAGGLLVVSGESDNSAIQRILGNEALASGSTSAVMDVLLETPLIHGLATSDVLVVFDPPWRVRQSIVPTAASVGVPVGIAMHNFSSAAPYGWVCTRGPVMAESAADVENGRPITLSSVVGRVARLAYASTGVAIDLPKIGFGMGDAAAADDLVPVWMQLE